jgi:imidazoleglycerol-phosphate dehydratase
MFSSLRRLFVRVRIQPCRRVRQIPAVRPAIVPMDETLATVAVDLPGRPALVWKVDLPQVLLGSFQSELGEEFFRGFSNAVAMNLHAILHHGSNTHHILEAVFKATGRAPRMAVEKDPRATGVPSTKGVL